MGKDIPEIGPTEVLIKVKACGICSSDVHMAQSDDDGYIWYPGLTAFPCTLGHEFSGIVAKTGEATINKRTGKKYEEGELVTSAEDVVPALMVIPITVRDCRSLGLQWMELSLSMLK